MRNRLQEHWMRIRKGTNIYTKKGVRRDQPAKLIGHIDCCPEWINDYLAFHDWSIQNGYDLTCESMYTLYVKPNAKFYSPETCYWVKVPPTVAGLRAGRRNRFLTYKDLTLSLPAWARLLGVSKEFLRRRYLEADGNLEEALKKVVKSRPKYRMRRIRTMEEAYNLYKTAKMMDEESPMV